jgi:hypothetical protein
MVTLTVLGLIVLATPRKSPSPPLPNPNGYDDFLRAGGMVTGDVGIEHRPVRVNKGITKARFEGRRAAASNSSSHSRGIAEFCCAALSIYVGSTALGLDCKKPRPAW